MIGQSGQTPDIEIGTSRLCPALADPGAVQRLANERPGHRSATAAETSPIDDRLRGEAGRCGSARIARAIASAEQPGRSGSGFQLAWRTRRSAGRWLSGSADVEAS